MARARTNGIELEYDVLGEPGAEPVLLVAGLGAQMTCWTTPFRTLLAASGRQVVRFDNRDCGLSSHLAAAPAPEITAVAAATARGERPDVPYGLDAMAADAVGLLDALGIERAHLVGRSMGGMIALLAASAYPDRILSVAPVMSTTGNPALPQPAPEVLAALTRPAPSLSDDREGFVAHGLRFARLIASPGQPFDAKERRAQILADAERAHDPAGFRRQLAAMAAAGDIRPRLSAVAAPTRVVHGAADVLLSPAGGRDIAASVPGAGLTIIDGMGHEIPPGFYGDVAAAILGNVRLASEKPEPHLHGRR